METTELRIHEDTHQIKIFLATIYGTENLTIGAKHKQIAILMHLIYTKLSVAHSKMYKRFGLGHASATYYNQTCLKQSLSVVLRGV